MLHLNGLILNTKWLRELNKTIDITYSRWFLHFSFYLYFIEKPTDFIHCIILPLYVFGF